MYHLYSLLFINIPKFLKNIWLFRRALWNHEWRENSGTLLFIEIAIGDIAKNLKTKGRGPKGSRLKEVFKMERVVKILKNIREDRYFDLIELELKRAYSSKDIKFVTIKDNPKCYELVDYSTDEQKKFNSDYINEVIKIQNKEWIELWEILKGQDYLAFDKEKDWNEQFDGSGLNNWLD